MAKAPRKTQKGTVAVVGLGYVGLPLALLAERKGYGVRGIDINETRVRRIMERAAPFEDSELSKQLRVSSLVAATDFSLIDAASVVIICVPTPVDQMRHPNLGPVRGACRLVGESLKRGQLVVLESTVNPGVSREIVLPLLEEGSGLKAGRDFFLAHCPERVNPGDRTWHVEDIPRVVGGLDKESLRRAAAFYRSILNATVTEMGSLEEAESVKIVENSFRDVNIALVNELAMSFSRLDIDVVNVINGAATKPFAFMPHYPGAGVGGHCIPVDPYYLIDYAKTNGFHHDFLSLARRINEHMPAFTVEQVAHALNDVRRPLKGSVITVLGLAYKPDVDDIRESPALEIVDLLKEENARVRTYDPHVPARSTAGSLDEALGGADVALIATAHREFRALAADDFIRRGVRVVVDGRNCLQKEELIAAGIAYRGIGR